jgi:hypothetical protein
MCLTCIWVVSVSSPCQGTDYTEISRCFPQYVQARGLETAMLVLPYIIVFSSDASNSCSCTASLNNLPNNQCRLILISPASHHFISVREPSRCATGLISQHEWCHNLGLKLEHHRWCFDFQVLLVITVESRKVRELNCNSYQFLLWIRR